MPPLLRSRIAYFAVFGSFLIPVGFSSLRGLTHTVTCEEQSATPFSVQTLEANPATITTSKVFDRGEPVTLCEGLVLDMGVTPVSEDSVDVALKVTNTSQKNWKGSVSLKVGSSRVPVDIGLLRPQQTREETLSLSAAGGPRTIEGTLFVGP